MSSLSRFKERNNQRIVAQKELNAKFLFNGNSATEIKGENDVTVKAAVVNRQNKDMAHVYTHLNTPLKIGSTWEVKGLHFLITEEIIEIKDVNWHQYNAFLCNIQIENHWGYFKGPGKSFINLNVKEKAFWESGQKAVLLLPSETIGFRDKIILNGRPWIVQEYDNISNPGMTYYSLVPTTANKTDNPSQSYIEKKPEVPVIVIEEPEEQGNYILVAPNMEVTLSTEQGFIQFTNPIEILTRKSNQVCFQIPFGVVATEITVLEKGNKKIYSYRTEPLYE